ncbi:MAG: hypothetical protein R3B06_26880 [Kofleriaceae bacterium]
MRSLGPLLCILVLAGGCFTARHASVPLRGNPDGAACYQQCAAAASGAPDLACVAACPSAQAGRGVCGADREQACAQTRRFSTWRTAGVVVLGVVAVGLVSQ